MTPPDEVKAGLVRQWLAKGEEDLGLARHIVEHDVPFLNAAGFHAQQAVEKSLKAYLVWVQVTFPKTHDLGSLLKVLAVSDYRLAHSIEETVQITDYAVEIRYPGDVPPLAIEEASAAVDIATNACLKIKAALEAAGFSS